MATKKGKFENPASSPWGDKRKPWSGKRKSQAPDKSELQKKFLDRLQKRPNRR